MGIEQEQNSLLTGATIVKSKRKTMLIILGALAIIAIIAVIVVLMETVSFSKDKSTNWELEFFKGPSAERAKHNSQLFSNITHVAATEQNNRIAQEIGTQFENMGLETELLYYDDIYLSQYNGSSLSQVNPSNPAQTIHEFDLTEAYLAEDPTSNTSLRTQAWLAYSASGDVSGYLVYVNYGNEKDFEILMNDLEFNTEQKPVIALVRYGELLRGIKALNAATYGFKAVILFSDPQDYGYVRGDVLPDGPWLPESGFQRGSSAFLNRCFGNPSEERAKDRCGYDVADILPSIPIIPISYYNAKILMEKMGGMSVDENDLTKDWEGGISVPYKIGTVHEADGVMVNLSVSNEYVPKRITNVQGFMQGTTYSNETIIFGAHRDAWIYGAVDPVSGTTSVIEIARAFSRIYKKGWRPKRNLLFMSWDAEEFNIIGSTSFAEELFSTETDEHHVVAYFNQDIAVSGGPDFTVLSDPLMQDVAEDCMTKVKQPYIESHEVQFGEDTIWDYWSATNEYPKMFGSGSDYAVFVHEFGIPAFDASFRARDYGTYHSVYDSYYTMANYLDPEYEYLRAVARVVGCVGFAIADNEVIPFRTTSLYDRLILGSSGFLYSMKELATEYNCNVDDEYTSRLSAAAVAYGAATRAFDAYGDDLQESEDDAQIKKYNDALMKLSAMFLYDDGLPTRKIFKNLIVAPALDNGYGAQVLPFIAYVIKFECENAELMGTAYNVTANAFIDAANFLQSSMT